MANGTFFSSMVRLYHATFDRPSDNGGVGYWASKLAKSEMTFQDVAQSFMESEEFQKTYGSELSNEDFVRLLYENVLGRAPDEEGLAYWLQVMEEGSLRHEVLVGFSESDEHIEKVESEHPDELAEAESIENSLEDAAPEDEDESEEEGSEDDNDDSDGIDDSADDSSEDDSGDDLSDEETLTLLYNAVFDRDPDQQGLGYWLGELASSDLNIDDVIESFMASDEFTERYGDNLTDEDFIEALYNNALGRPSDAQGKGFWISQLASGVARGDILEAFAESEEHIEIVLSGTTTVPTDETLI